MIQIRLIWLFNWARETRKTLYGFGIIPPKLTKQQSLYKTVVVSIGYKLRYTEKWSLPHSKEAHRL